MYFSHSSEVWKNYPELVPGVLLVEEITADVRVDGRTARFFAVAEARLAARSESELPEVRAWRGVFSRMGLKPTQYRSASESLLRRFRKEKSLPRLHPVIDVCNAVSLAFAIPIAVFDVSRIADYLEVRHAAGSETYLTFSGEIENPEPGEIIFADAAGRAHARRWTNRQSAYSAVRKETAPVLIVTEAVHPSGLGDIERHIAALGDELEAIGCRVPRNAILKRASPRFEF